MTMKGLMHLLSGVAHEGVGDLVLDVSRADALQAFPPGGLSQLLDVVFGEAGQRLAIVELELLDAGEVVLLGVLEARQHGPHGGHLQSVWSDVLANPPVVEVLCVDARLGVPLRDVGHVDLDGAVAQSFHELIGLKLSVLGLVGVSENHLVDGRLSKLLWLDDVLLTRPQKVVQESHIELEDFDELDEPTVGDAELTVKVECPRIGV
jgi:hypothetical protein